MRIEHRCLAELTVSELAARAARYRRMAATATTAQIRDSLLRVGERYEQMVADKSGLSLEMRPASGR